MLFTKKDLDQNRLLALLDQWFYVWIRLCYSKKFIKIEKYWYSDITKSILYRWDDIYNCEYKNIMEIDVRNSNEIPEYIRTLERLEKKYLFTLNECGSDDNF